MSAARAGLLLLPALVLAGCALLVGTAGDGRLDEAAARLLTPPLELAARAAVEMTAGAGGARAGALLVVVIGALTAAGAGALVGRGRAGEAW